jgi:single-strand DNA-binding protein
MNKVILIGRISSDIDARRTQSGTSTATFSVAVDRNMGAGKEKATDFIRCVAWGKTSEFLARYFSKGKQIALEGNIKTGSYEKDGVKHYTTDVWVDKVEFVGSKGDGGQQTQTTPAQTETPTTPAEPVESANSEDIPF